MTLYRKDRTTDNHGGVMIATKPGLVVTPANELNADCEIVWIKKEIQGCRKLYIGSFEFRIPASP